MPRRDPAGRKAQLARAADSIAANIAEGCGADSPRDFARFLDNAIKSMTETEHHLLAVRKQQWVDEPEVDPLIDEVSQIRRMVYPLRRKILRSLGG